MKLLRTISIVLALSVLMTSALVQASTGEAYRIALTMYPAQASEGISGAAEVLGSLSAQATGAILTATIRQDARAQSLVMSGRIGCGMSSRRLWAAGPAETAQLSNGSRFLYGVVEGEVIIEERSIPMTAVIHFVDADRALIAVTLGTAGDAFSTLLFGEPFPEIKEYFDLAENSASDAKPLTIEPLSSPPPLEPFGAVALTVNGCRLVTVAPYVQHPMQWNQTYDSAGRAWSNTVQASQWLDYFGNPMPQTTTYDARVDRVRFTMNAPRGFGLSGPSPMSQSQVNTVTIPYIWGGSPQLVSFSYTVSSTLVAVATEPGSMSANIYNWTEYRMNGWNSSATDLLYWWDAHADTTHGFKYRALQTPLHQQQDLVGQVSGDLRYILYRKQRIAEPDYYVYWSESLQTGRAIAPFTVTMQ